MVDLIVDRIENRMKDNRELDKDVFIMEGYSSLEIAYNNFKKTKDNLLGLLEDCIDSDGYELFGKVGEDVRFTDIIIELLGERALMFKYDKKIEDFKDDEILKTVLNFDEKVSEEILSEMRSNVDLMLDSFCSGFLQVVSLLDGIVEDCENGGNWDNIYEDTNTAIAFMLIMNEKKVEDDLILITDEEIVQLEDGEVNVGISSEEFNEKFSDEDFNEETLNRLKEMGAEY